MRGTELPIPTPKPADEVDPKHKWDHVNTKLPTKPPGTTAAPPPPTFTPPWKDTGGGLAPPAKDGGIPKKPAAGGPDAPPIPNLLGGDIPGLADLGLDFSFLGMKFMPWLTNPADKKPDEQTDGQPKSPTMDPADMTPYQSPGQKEWWKSPFDLF